MFRLGLNKEATRTGLISWASVYDKGAFRKGFFASVRRLKYGQVFRDDLVKVWRSWIVGEGCHGYVFVVSGSVVRLHLV